MKIKPFLRIKFGFQERIVFFPALVFYGIIGFFFASTTTLVYNPKYVHDLYLGFDNTLLNTSFVRHPLLKTISLALNKLTFFLADKSYLIVFICSVLLSLHLVVIFKYLKKIVALSSGQCAVVLAFYSVFSTNLILSFTFESYVFSTLLLSSFYLIAAHFKLRKLSIPNTLFYPFAIATAGITVTNLLKLFAGTYFEKKSILLKRFLICFGVLGVGYLMFWTKTSESISHTSQFLTSGDSWIKSVFYNFFGGSAIFPDLKISDFNYENLELIKTINGTYPISLLKIVTTAILMVLILGSALYNFRNILVKMLIFSFSVDILIHVIFKLGLNEAYIFGGNFVFIYPLLIGFTIKKLPNKKLQQSFIILLLIMFVAISVLNFRGLTEIYQFGNQYYPKN